MSKKAKPGRWLQKRLKPSKWHQKRLKQMVKKPSAWRKWKPFRQRGLGLGKFVTGALQAITPTSSSMYDKLKYMEEADTLLSFSGNKGSLNR